MVFRGTPLLIQLFVVYYGLASLPAVRASFAWVFLRDAFNCAVLALALCTAAYQSEIFRGALLAVPHGQVEAARACGMSGLFLFRRAIFPIALRHALPAYSTEMISMVKSTALVSLITLWDVLSVALKIRNDTLVTYLPLIIAGAIYFVVNYIIGAALPRARAAPFAASAAEAWLNEGIVIASEAKQSRDRRVLAAPGLLRRRSPSSDGRSSGRPMAPRNDADGADRSSLVAREKIAHARRNSRAYRREHAQEFRPARSLKGRIAHRQRRRRDLDPWLVRLGQEHVPALHQPA